MKLTARPVLPPLPDVEYRELRESIRENGILTRLLAMPDGILIDGHERFRVIGEIGLKKYPVRVIVVADEPERVMLAIRCNAERRHLTRAQRQELLERVILSAPEKSERELADLCRVSPRTAGRAKLRVLAGASDDAPRVTVGRDGKTYRHRPAYTAETAQQRAEAGRLLGEIGDVAPPGGTSLRTLRHLSYRRQAEIEASGPVARLPASVRIETCCFRRLERRAGDLTGRCDLLILDPPWGSDWHANLPDLASMAARIMKPGSICAVYAGMGSLPTFMAEFGRVLEYRWLLACKNTNLYTPKKLGCIKSQFRPVVLFSKGSFRSPRDLGDLIDVAEMATRPPHPLNWQEPWEESVYLIERLTRPGALVCDLTLGSGTVANATAVVGGGREFVGCDVDPTCTKLARKRVAEALMVAEGA